MKLPGYNPDKKSYISAAELLDMLGGDIKTLRIMRHEDRIEVFPDIHALAKVYIEPTSLCNLNCITCVRKTWQEPMGSIDMEVFDHLVEQLKDFSTTRTVMFGGLGEPLFHPDILEMVGKIKNLGLRVEMTTNGTLLNEAMLQGLLAKGLDMLWVSFDGATPDSFDDIRAGASFHQVVASLKRLAELNTTSMHQITVGITFVAMKKNVADLTLLWRLAKETGAAQISVSNVIPYHVDMVDQMLCTTNISMGRMDEEAVAVPISIPIMDINETTRQPLHDLFHSHSEVSVMRNRVGAQRDNCRFIQECCTFIRWDGLVSPCMGLLHSHKTYFPVNYTERIVNAYSVGSVLDQKLVTIWNSPEYTEFRERVDQFNFSWCFQCVACVFAQNNEIDCSGSEYPYCCGGCLWGQSVIQCP